MACGTRSTPASPAALAFSRSRVQPHRRRARNLEVVRQVLHLLAVPVQGRDVIAGADVRALLEHRQHLLVNLLALLRVGGRASVGNELIELGIAELAILPGCTTLDSPLQHIAIDQCLEPVARETELELAIVDDANVYRSLGARQGDANVV